MEANHLIFNFFDSTNTRGNDNTKTIFIKGLYIQIGMIDSFLGCVQGIQRIVIKTIGIFLHKVFIKRKILDFCCIMHIKVTMIKFCYLTNSDFSSCQTIPKFFWCISDWRCYSITCYYYAI